jgi:hypothetical protein
MTSQPPIIQLTDILARNAFYDAGRRLCIVSFGEKSEWQRKALMQWASALDSSEVGISAEVFELQSVVGQWTV